MYQVGIVECMQDAEDALMKALARYSEEQDLRFHVRVFRSAEESLAAMSDECDILFVSCELSDADGLALAAEIRSRRPDVILILLSAQAENPAALPSVELRHGCRLCRIYGIHASFVGLQTGNDLLSLRKICS